MMNFLDENEIKYNVFSKYLESHKKIRNAMHIVLSMKDIVKYMDYPNIQYYVKIMLPRYNLLLEDINYNKIKKVEYIDGFIIPPSLINLTYLNCSSTFIKIIPESLINLIYLNCSRTLINTIPCTLVNLEYLDCSSTSISVIPDTLIRLEYLNYRKTNIILLPRTLNNIKYLIN
jgi:hypothetical protein